MCIHLVALASQPMIGSLINSREYIFCCLNISLWLVHKLPLVYQSWVTWISAYSLFTSCVSILCLLKLSLWLVHYLPLWYPSCVVRISSLDWFINYLLCVLHVSIAWSESHPLIGSLLTSTSCEFILCLLKISLSMVHYLPLVCPFCVI